MITMFIGLYRARFLGHFLNDYRQNSEDSRMGAGNHKRTKSYSKYSHSRILNEKRALNLEPRFLEQFSVSLETEQGYLL